MAQPFQVIAKIVLDMEEAAYRLIVETPIPMGEEAL